MPVRSKVAIYALLILVSLIFSLPMIMMAVSYTHLTLPTIYSV